VDLPLRVELWFGISLLTLILQNYALLHLNSRFGGGKVTGTQQKTSRGWARGGKFVGRDTIPLHVS